MPSEQQRIPEIIGALYGFNLPEWIKERAKEFFVYGSNFLPLAAGAQGTADIAVQADSDFLIVATSLVLTDAANVVFAANRPLTVTITDAASGRALMNAPMHVDNVFGTMQLPGYLPLPGLFKRGGTISTTMVNLDAANAFNVRFAYLGFKIFNAPADVNEG